MYTLLLIHTTNLIPFLNIDLDVKHCQQTSEPLVAMDMRNREKLDKNNFGQQIVKEVQINNTKQAWFVFYYYISSTYSQCAWLCVLEPRDLQ